MVNLIYNMNLAELGTKLSAEAAFRKDTRYGNYKANYWLYALASKVVRFIERLAR